MYNFTILNPENYIAEDLPAINLNYQNLDNWVTSIETSATNFWGPLSGLYVSRKPLWEKAITTVIQNSAKWDMASTVVEAYSASWLKPMSIIFPNVYNSAINTSSIITTIENWLNEKYPVLIQGEIPYFVEGQTMYVSQYSQEEVVQYKRELKQLFASTTCSTKDGIGWSNCLTKYKGTVNCGPAGTLYCDGQTKTCPTASDVKCEFQEPYIATTTDIIGHLLQNRLEVDDNFHFKAPVDSRPTFGLKEGGGWFRRRAKQVAIGAVQANLYINYKDTRELPVINTFKYIVKDCKWTYAKAIHGAPIQLGNPDVSNNQFDLQLVESGAETGRGYYMVNSDGFATLKFIPVGKSEGDRYDVNVNGISFMTNPYGETVLKFTGLTSRTYVVRITNLVSGLEDTINLSIGYRSKLGFAQYSGLDDMFIGDRFIDEKTIMEDQFGDSLPYAAYVAGDIAQVDAAGGATYKLINANKNAYRAKTFPKAKNILYTSNPTVSVGSNYVMSVSNSMPITVPTLPTLATLTTATATAARSDSNRKTGFSRAFSEAARGFTAKQQTTTPTVVATPTAATTPTVAGVPISFPPSPPMPRIKDASIYNVKVFSQGDWYQKR